MLPVIPETPCNFKSILFFLLFLERSFFSFQRVHEAATHRRRPRDERVALPARSGTLLARLAALCRPAGRFQRSGPLLQQPSARHQLGLPAAAARHHRAAKVQHAALPALRAQLPQHAGEPRREGALVRNEQEDVGRGAAPHVQVFSRLTLLGASNVLNTQFDRSGKI